MKGALLKHPKQDIENALYQNIPFNWSTKCRGEVINVWVTKSDIERMQNHNQINGNLMLILFILKHGCLDSLAKLTSTKVLTVHGDADTRIPIEDAYSFNRVLKCNKLCIIEKGDHFFKGQEEKVMNLIVSWLKNE